MVFHSPFFRLHRLPHRFSGPDRSSASGAILPVLLAVLVSVLVSMICAPCASARPAKRFETATLVETAKYIPCSDQCSALTSPAGAFCFRLSDQGGDEVLVGEGKSYLHGDKFSSLEELAGKQVLIRFSQRSLWIKPPDRATVKLRRGSLFEQFKDSGCVREVHKPILAEAYSSKRSAKIPDGAIAIAGSGKGDFQPLFLWFQCAIESDAAPHGETIACRRWYENGDSDGTDWYCAQTADGAPVAADLAASSAIDPLLSQAGRLVLKSGAVLRHDNRARTNDKLDRPGEACR